MKNLKWKLLFAVLMSFSVISATRRTYSCTSTLDAMPQQQP